MSKPASIKSRLGGSKRPNENDEELTVISGTEAQGMTLNQGRQLIAGQVALLKRFEELKRTIEEESRARKDFEKLVTTSLDVIREDITDKQGEGLQSTAVKKTLDSIAAINGYFVNATVSDFLQKASRRCNTCGSSGDSTTATPIPVGSKKARKEMK